MVAFHFFTDVDLLGNQAAADAFGPVSTSPSTSYQVTSVHHPIGSTAPKAYAVCDGQVLVQDAGGGLVNLVLKPTVQPPFTFPKIKFFIYRGIQESSLVNGSEVAPATNNDLTNSIWQSQQARNTSAGTSDKPPAEALGLDITGNGSTEAVFYRDNVSFQLPLVRSGWSLGTFDSSEFGFEIMFEAIGFDPELPVVRSRKNVISVASLPSSPTQAQEFEWWHDKEVILNFVDPCAFFGTFYNHTLKVRSSDGSTSKEKKDALYDGVLLIYSNRNRTYVDIRNEYSHSINYFKNYGTYSVTDLQCAFDDASPLAARNYYATAWPLMLIETNDLSVASSSANKAIVRLALPEGDNALPTVYLSSGYLDDSYPREPKAQARLMDLAPSDGFAGEVIIAVPIRQASPAVTAVSTYTKLVHFRRIDPTAAPPSSTVVRSTNYLDTLFAPLAMVIPSSASAPIKSVIYGQEAFVEGNPSAPGDYLVNAGIAVDPSNVTLFALPVIVRDVSGDKAAAPFLLCGENASGGDTYLNKLMQDYAPQRLHRSELVVSTKTTPQIDVVDDAPASAAPKPDFKRFIALVVGHATFAALSAAAAAKFAGKYRVYLGVTEGTQQMDDRGFPYTAYGLRLRGLVQAGAAVAVEEIHTDPASNYTTDLQVLSA